MPDAVDLSALAKRWPSAYVARKEVGAFTGGLVSPGTLANSDSQGSGPEGAFRVGRNTGYPVQSLIAWLQNRAVGKKLDMAKARAAKGSRNLREK